MTDISLAHPIWRHLFLDESITKSDFQPVAVARSFLYDSNPIIIGGCGRSGTTLLASILGSFSSVYLIPTETSLLCPGCYGALQKPLPLSSINRNLSISMDTLSKLCFDQTCTNKQTWCEKTPRNIYYFEKLHQLFDGNISLINVVRNGLDVVLSKHSSDPSGYWVSPERWVTEVDLGIHLSKRIRMLTIKYEDLVVSPKATLSKISDFTKIGELKHLSDDWYNKTPLHTDFSFGGKVSAINKYSLGKWKTDTTGRSKFLLDYPNAINLLNFYNYI